MKCLKCVAVIALSAASAWAMPTKEEVKRVQPLMNELMSAHVKDYKANRKSAKEVGDAAFGFAKDAKGEAAKYILLKGVIHYYSLAKEFDRAADSLEAMREQISDLPLDEVESIASKALARAGNGGAQRLRDIQRVAAEQMKAMADIASFKAELKKKPNGTTAMRGLAKAYVRFGDWPRALKVFAALGVEAAIYERNPVGASGYNALKAADYWWDFNAKDTSPYRVHAAALYRRAIEEGLVDGLMRTIIEKRIVEAEAASKMAAFPVSGTAASGGPRSVAATDGAKPVPPTTTTTTGDSHISNDKRYCIIDLSPGPNAQRYSVSWRDTEPASSGWQDMYKTTKLVLRRIEPGTFIMGENQKDESHRVTFTKPFYIGVFEVTQKQYALVTGDDPSKYKGPMRPVTNVSVEQLRGSSVEYDWPTSRKAAPNSFIGRLRERTGLDCFELPTEAQWEYACRAGTTTLRYDGSDIHDIDSLMKLGRVIYNQKARSRNETVSEAKKHKPDGKGGYLDFHTSVGLYKPNAWGLYDMYGNVWERCVSRRYDSFGENPLGRVNGAKERRVVCGGCYHTSSVGVTSVERYWEPPWFSGAGGSGFRLVLNVDER